MIRILVTCIGLSLAAPVSAQAPVQDLDKLLERVQRLDATQLEPYRPGLDDRPLPELLAATQAELDAATRRRDQLSQEFERVNLELDDLGARVRAETADLSELFDVIRRHAGDVAGGLRNSLVSAQLGSRTELPARLAGDYIPALRELHGFHSLMLEEILQSGRVIRFATEVISVAGIPATTDVVRVGTFNLIAGDKYLHYVADTGTIQELAHQPARRYRADASGLFDAEGGVSTMSVDPTAGQLLSLLIQTPDLTDRINQAGWVGYIIIALGATGMLIGFYRMAYLGLAGRRINRQLDSDTSDQNNALGRILAVYGVHSGVDTETLELKLDEAIIRETPRLEKGQTLLKVIAAVAPLLGLLGTVIGMIETFQQITLFGTSDPRLMADGIAKALVTTMLGLLVAIPMVLIHSLVAGRSKHLIEILEEQSASIVARQAEKSQ